VHVKQSTKLVMVEVLAGGFVEICIFGVNRYLTLVPGFGSFAAS